jgi:membrane-bound lytic murein transglycosylase D
VQTRFTVVLLAAACGSPATQEPPPAAEPPAAAPPLAGAAVTLDDLQARALDECQGATELLDRGDVATAVARIDRCYALMLELPDDEAGAQSKQDIRLLVAELVARAYNLPESEPAAPSPAMASWDLALPLLTNDHVQREIQSFTTVERADFLAAYQRSGRWRPMIVERLQKAGLPSQLSWLPLVESNFKTTALSRASALGLWQFISSTGLRYGLRRDEWIDERLDPEKSTDAAIAYFADLHRMFGDWPKALAAYNCGENRIARLSNRSATDYLDFWDLYDTLPRETRRYVPRLIAVLQILEDPAKYGVTLPELDAPLTETTSITIARPVKLDALDVALGLPAGSLAAYNPELRHASTPRDAYQLRVPAQYAEALMASVAKLPEYVPPPKPEYVTHRVRAGETLSVIAERYGTTVGAIMAANRLKSAHRIWPGQRLRVPVRI